MRRVADTELIERVVGIWGKPKVAEAVFDRDKALLGSWLKETGQHTLSAAQHAAAIRLDSPAYQGGEEFFDFVDLFAGIGGIRRGFDAIGGRCVLTAEWDEYARRTYRANYPECPGHEFVRDIKDISQPSNLDDKDIIEHIGENFRDHDVLLAGFPCQPFSIAGVSKKNALGRDHGFKCQDQGQLFFDVVRILMAKRPAFAVLENVKNLKSHDQGRTFKVITTELERIGYWIADLHDDKPDPKILDGSMFVPQHRERVVLVCVRKDVASDLRMHDSFTLRDIPRAQQRLTLKEVLDPNEAVDPKYTLSEKLWQYLQDYKAKHQKKGNGFGFGLVRHDDPGVARTLSARYYKDGSEILVDQSDLDRRPRRLTPVECARLMGFCTKKTDFRIPVSDTRAYKQFGNSVVVPVFESVARHMQPYILEYKRVVSEAA